MRSSKFRIIPLLRATGVCFIIAAICVSVANSRIIPSQPPDVLNENQSSPVFTIVPDKMNFTGDVVKCNGVINDPTIRSWCNGLPKGSILLGIDPNSPAPENWDGAEAIASVLIDGINEPTIAVISVSWADQDGKGIHSPQKSRIASITWDGMTIWNKATRDASTFGDYYAAQHYPVKATAILSETASHTLTLQVPANTAWDISSITINIYPLPKKLNGIAYSPFRDCQNPDWGPFPTKAEIREDIARLYSMSNGIRTYSTLDMVGEIPQIANERDLPVTVGAWLGKDANKNREEIDALIALANDPNLANIKSLIVGNEVLLRGDLTDAELLTYIEEVKNNVNVPVTTAEISGILQQHPAIINAVDFIMIHVYPYWEKQPIEGAAERVADEYLEWQQTYGKRIVIGETGWPSAGPARGPAVPSLENQQRFFYEFMIEAEKNGIEFFYFDAFDELWKREGGVGSHWGYIDSARIGKHEVQSVLIPEQELSLFLTPFPSSNQVQIPSITRNQPMEVQPREFIVYDEYASQQNHFTPSGWMGDRGDVVFYECDLSDPFSGEQAIRVTYDPQGPEGWSGIYWQEPPNNWGTIENGGYDLSGARGISFAARGEKGGEWISFGLGGIGCEEPKAPYPDSLCPEQRFDPDPITLSKSWQVYTLPLSNDLDLSNIVGGFFWEASREDNPNGATFFLDDIKYLFDVDIPLQPHAIYYGPRLAKDYDMGVDTSGGQTSWVTDHGGYMCMSYPPGQQWGAVFITVGPPKPSQRPGKNLSMYQTLSLDLRGAESGERVWIGLKDNMDPDDGSETKILISNLTNGWQTYPIPLSSFITADLTHLYVVIEFVFETGTSAETVCFRNIRYLP